jgi:hypothetical protein
MRCRGLLLLMLLISVMECASQAAGPQTGGIRLPNCNIGVFGRVPNVNCSTGGVVIPMGR